MAFNVIYQRPAITKLDLTEHQCFPKEVSELELGKYTFVYGPNGSGKSTILRELSRDSRCVGGEVDLRTFDQRFIRGLLSPEHSFEGVLRVIDAPDEVARRLQALTEEDGEVSKALAKVHGLEKTLEEKNREIETEQVKFREACWELKKKVPKDLREIGVHMSVNSKRKFAERVGSRLRDKKAPTVQTTQSFEFLSQSLKEIGEDGQDQLPPLPPLPPSVVVTEAIVALMAKEMRPDANNPLASLLEELGHSDWVKKGLGFLNEGGSDCPFCQQPISNELSEKLRNLFAAEYDLAVRDLSDFKNSLVDFQDSVEDFLTALSVYPEAVVEKLSKQVKEHKRYALELEKRIDAKLRDMSQTGELKSLPEPTSWDDDYEIAKGKIAQINTERRNITAARKKVGVRVFDRFVAELALGEYKKFTGATETARKAVNSLNPKLNQARTKLEELKQEVRTLEAQTSSTKHVMNEVNATLKALGFSRFHLAPLDRDGSRYRVVRADGEIAGPTLSEGEKTLVSFLYFFHQLSNASTDGADSRPLMAVIDDPISSLDSSTLFAVSLLCRKLIDLCTQQNSRMCQFLLLTHNAYFFQEVTFQKLGETPPDGRIYYTFRKDEGGMTTAIQHESNPIVSAYEQLWTELRSDRRAGRMSVHTQNSMRRILETYFGSIGGFGTDVLSQLDLGEQLAAKSLLAWINDGSHNIPWNVDYSPTSVDSEFYHQVFRRIFEVEGQLGHYQKMMQLDSVDVDSTPSRI